MGHSHVSLLPVLRVLQFTLLFVAVSHFSTLLLKYELVHSPVALCCRFNSSTITKENALYLEYIFKLLQQDGQRMLHGPVQVQHSRCLATLDRILKPCGEVHKCTLQEKAGEMGHTVLDFTQGTHLGPGCARE